MLGLLSALHCIAGLGAISHLGIWGSSAFLGFGMAILVGFVIAACVACIQFKIELKKLTSKQESRQDFAQKILPYTDEALLQIPLEEIANYPEDRLNAL